MSLACYKHSRSISCCCYYYYLLLYYPHPLSPIWPPSTNLALQAICLLTPESALGLKCPIFQSSETQFKVIFNSTCHPNPTAGHGHLYGPFLNNNEEPPKKRIPLRLVFRHHEGAPHPHPEVTSQATLGRFSIPLTARE